MGFFDSGSPSITVAVDVLFPSNVISGPGVTVDKTNAVWSVGLDYVDLVENTSIATPSGYFVAVWDAALSRYEKVRLDNLNLPTLVDFRTPIGDADYSVSVNDRYLGLTAQLTAIRTITLPAAATVPPGRQLVLQDEVGGVSPGLHHSLVPTGADMINGSASWLQKTKRGGVVLRSNGANAWNVLVLDERTAVADAAYAAGFGDSLIAFTSLGAPRNVTLPAASSYPVGKRLTIVDESGNCSSIFTIGILRAGSDTINGGTNAAITMAYGYLALESDGVSKWTVVGASAVSSAQINDATAPGRALLTAPSVSAQRVLLRVDQHTNVADANYAALATDQLVAFTAITAARTVTLPAASSVNPGQPIVIVDESGASSATSTITVTRQGTDTINGQASAMIASAFGYLELVSNGVNKWTLIDTSITSANIADASAIGRSILTTPSIAAARGLIIDQRTAVGDANYSVLSTDRYIATTTTLTAPRTWILPAANTMNPGQEVVIYDEGGGVTATNTITITRSGSDTINGATSFALDRAFQGISLRTDGVGKWSYEDPAGPIDDTPIGATTPSTGAFTTVSASSLAAPTLTGTTLSVTGSASLPSTTTVNGGALPIRGYIGGLTLSNDAASPNTVFDISAGACAADDASLVMSLSAFTKSTAAFAAGSGNGSLDTGTIGPNQWLHGYVIANASGAVDVLTSLAPPPGASNPLSGVTISIASPAVVTWQNHGLQVGSPVVFSTTGALPGGITAGTTYFVISTGFVTGSFEISTTQGGAALNTSGSQSGTHTGVSTPALPAGFTRKRRVGSLRTDASGHILAFSQNGDEFLWVTAIGDVNVSNLGTAPTLFPLTVPVGVKVNALNRMIVGGGGGGVLITSPDENALAFNSPLGNANTLASGAQGQILNTRTNVSGQIRMVASATSTVVQMSTYGWIDTRAKFN